MKVMVYTAHLGGFDPAVEYARQELPEGVEMDFHNFTDENFPPRRKSMTPRLQARICKMFGWELLPGYDYYIWVDGSCALLNPMSVAWFLGKCAGHHMAVFKHPDRNSIQEEYEFLRDRMDTSWYLHSRYDGEFLEEQMDALRESFWTLDCAKHEESGRYRDERLFASTSFVYENNLYVQDFMKEWWFHTSRYHSIDQLAFPFLLDWFDITVNVIPDNYLKCPYLTYTRNGSWRKLA